MKRCKAKRSARSIGFARHLWLAALLLVAACAVPVEYMVNTTSDLPDANPGDRVCAGRSNLCSLRAAVEETNTHSSGDRVRIVLPGGIYELNGALALTHDNVSVSGDNPDTTAIHQIQSGERVLTISAPGDIWIGGVTLSGGSSGESGGAVRIDGNGTYSVTLSECRISENVAGFWGGGVYAQGADGALNILDCVVANNDSTGAGCTSGGGQSGGGGIMANGPRLTLFRSEVRDNCGSNGGGVRVNGGLDHLILQSTIAGNGAATRAGGLYIVNGGGRIEDSTIAENSGPEAGGILISGGQTIEITSATIVGNTSLGTSAGPTGAGGILSTDGAQVLLRNTVIASNNGAPLDCSGEFFSSGGNFIGTLQDMCKFAASASDVLDGGSPGLGALFQGSARTRTMSPNADSPLVNAGVPGCDPVDQRGQPAPVGAACDVGAVERQ
jgi:CSLREA domain-containing protein